MSLLEGPAAAAPVSRPDTGELANTFTFTVFPNTAKDRVKREPINARET